MALSACAVQSASRNSTPGVNEVAWEAVSSSLKGSYIFFFFIIIIIIFFLFVFWWSANQFTFYMPMGVGGIALRKVSHDRPCSAVSRSWWLDSVRAGGAGWPLLSPKHAGPLWGGVSRVLPCPLLRWHYGQLRVMLSIWSKSKRNEWVGLGSLWAINHIYQCGKKESNTVIPN